MCLSVELDLLVEVDKSIASCKREYFTSHYFFKNTKISKRMGKEVEKMNTSQTETEWDLKDKYLRLKKKSIRKLITLPPKYLGDLNKGIEQAIFKSDQEVYNE